MPKQVVIDEPLRVAEVHPPGAYEKLAALFRESADEVREAAELRPVPCPACGASEREPGFEKDGFAYEACANCATLYVSPRPSEATQQAYRQSSAAALYRAGDEYEQAIAEAAKETAYGRAEWIARLVGSQPAARRGPIVQAGARDGYLAQALFAMNLAPVFRVPAGPRSDLDDDALRDGRVLDSLAAAAGSNARLVALFDILEGDAEPRATIEAARAALGPGGLLAITARCGSGLDVQALGSAAELFPLEHLNLLTVEGARALVEAVGFEIIELSTPGQLDVQLVERALRDGASADVPRFLRYMIEHRDESTLHRFQQFLQENRLSSHLRLVARAGR